MVFYLSAQGQSKDETMDIKRIWDRGGHNAYTDINFFKGKLYVVLREAASDIPSNDSEYGKLRVLRSEDGEFWESMTVIEKPGVDLRDPKLIVTRKKRLLILAKGVQYDGTAIKSIRSYTSLSDPEPKKFAELELLELEGTLNTETSFLWQMTWYNKTGYGVLSKKDKNDGVYKTLLVKNEKKMEIEIIKELDLEGDLTDATVRFLSGAEMMIIGKTGDGKGVMGTSKAPYTDWTWKPLNLELAGANFEIIPINKVLVGTALSNETGNYSALLLGKKDEDFQEAMKLPSGGDTGHVGFFTIAGYVWLSYHSSHEGKTSVYYARIPYSMLQ